VNNQNDNRFPKAASICLAFLLIIVAVLAGYDENHAAAEAFPEDMPTYSSDELVWVRQDQPIININDDPTAWDATEPRFAGSYGQYTITETEIAYHERWVDHEYEWYDVTIRTKFDRPPLVLNPPLRYKITAAASHSGTHNQGSIGYQFWYSSPYAAVIEPKEVLGYYPFDAWWDGTSSKEWMIDPPAILGEGDSFEISAGWWNCPPCNVMWTYKAEPANAVPHISLEVLQPTVEYRGEEVPPGETFYPEICPNNNTQSADICADRIALLDEAEIVGRCYAQAHKNLQALFELFDVKYKGMYDDTGQEYGTLIEILFDRGAIEACLPVLQANNETAPTIKLEQGAVLLRNLLNRQTFNVKTPLGTVAGEGNLATGYNPDTKTAFFRAYAKPLLVEATSGPILVLYPNQEVNLTSKGFGPVKEMPRVYLPMVK
jgi:hypothetical protein